MKAGDLNSVQKRKVLNSQDLKGRLFEKGIGQSLSSVKSPLSKESSSHLLLVNFGQQ